MNTKTVSIETPIDYCISHHSYIGDNPEWSLLDGSVHYSYPLSSFGGGHPFSCELIYDSNLSSVTSKKFPGMPSCFKLSFHARVIDSDDGYIFIDEEGHAHRFTEFINQGETFYKDTEGLGMVLEAHGLIDITNGFGMTLYFDEKGRLIKKSISGSFEITYTYNSSGSLVSVSDTTGGNRHFEFEYEGMLTCIKCYYGDNLISSINLTYSTKIMLNIVMKWQLLFIEKISSKDSSKTETLLKINYKEQIFREEPPAIEFDDFYKHSAFRITYDDKKITKLSFADIAKGIEFNEKSSLERSVNGNVVTIKDQNNFKTAYMLDQKGYIVSKFEVKDDGSLKSFNRPKGTLLTLNGSNIGIDGLPFCTSSRGFPVKITEYISGSENETSPLSNLTTDKGSSLFVYVRLNESHPGALISATGCIPTALNPYAVGIWQRARLGFKGKLSSSRIEISVCNDLGIAFSADICEPTISQSASERLTIDGNEINEFHQLTKGEERIRGIVSTSDLLTSLKHFVFSNSITPFLWMNNGHDVIQMDDVCFTVNNAKIPFADFCKTGLFLFAKYDSQRYLTHIHKLQKSGNKKITFEKTTSDAKGNILEHTTNIRSVTLDEIYDSSGLTCRNQYTNDGLPLKQYSAKGNIIAEYEYDRDGNLTCIKTESNTQHFTHDNGFLSSTSEGGKTKTFTYDGFEKIESVSFSDGTKNLFHYFGDHLIAISNSSSAIGFVPDYRKSMEEYYINDDSIEQREYGNQTQKTIYPDGSTITTSYDRKGNPLSIVSNDIGKAMFTLDEDTSLPILIKDDFSGMTTEIEYRADNGIHKMTKKKGDKIHFTKEELNGPYATEYLIGPGTLPRIKAITKQGTMTRINYEDYSHGTRVLSSDTYYDTLGRPYKKEGGIDYAYDYIQNTSLPRKITCDQFTEELVYAADSLRLTKVNFLGNIQNTQEFCYDSVGRIQSVTRTGDIGYNHIYRYEKGRLSEISQYLAILRNDHGIMTRIVDYHNKIDKEIRYDCCGNITKYGEMELHYQYGHLLKSVKYDDNELKFTYAYDGTRVEKTVNGVKTTFFYDDKTLLGQDIGSDTRIRYFRDADSYIGFTLEEKGTHASFLYIKDSFGNIIGIADSQGYLIGTYVYDEKGMLLKTVPNTNITGSKHILDINPLRYRGYYYDSETGFYYLHSRYYDPVSMSFLTPDDKDNIDGTSPSGTDPYCYCNYDPINYYDPYGKFPVLLGMILIGAAVGALSYTASSLISYAFTQKWSWSWCQFTGSIIGGAIGGALSAFSISEVLVGVLSSVVSTTSSMSLAYFFEDADYSLMDIICSSLINAFFAFIFSKLPKLKIKGFTAGRNSFSAIATSTATKYTNNVIKNMAMKTMGKIFAYNLFSSTYGILFDGFFSFPNDEDGEESE